MFTLFLIFTLLSGVVLVIGLVAGVARGRRGGGEVVAGSEDDVTATERSAAAMRGTSASVQMEANAGYAEMKLAVRERRWKDALPALLVFHGIMGVLLFGALALLAGTDARLVGIVATAVAVYAIASMWWNLSRV